MPLSWSRLTLFVTRSAWDLLLPDFIDKPLAVATHFYECFIVAAPEDQAELLKEGLELTSQPQVDALAREVVRHLEAIDSTNLPPFEEIRGITERLVQALRET